MKIGLDAAEALKPAAQCFFIMALTTKRVGAGQVVMDIRRDRSQHLIQRWLLRWSKLCRILFVTM
jgi:hypothetical protein